VPSSALTPQELDAYRAEADRFDSELMEEYYLHFAGHKERLELAPIFERHADLTTLEQAQRIGLAVDGDRGVSELWRFASEGYLGNLTKQYEEQIAALEADLTAEVDGETVSYRMLRPKIANEGDRARRQRLFDANASLTDEHLNPVYLESDRERRRAVVELGSATYLELYKRFGHRLDELADQCRELLDSTEKLWENAAERLFRTRLGIGLDEARSWDVPRLFRAPEWDAHFPATAMVPALEWTLDGLGIDLRSQQNVHLDLEEREKKTPRAFCAPIEVPGRVMLVIQPIGGLDDWRALFHEAGHTEHFAHTSADLPVEHKRLGDNAVTEGWAMLFDHLVQEPAWLTRRLDVGRPDELAWEGAAGLLYFVRRYSGKLLYELEYHGAERAEPLRDRYVEILGDALKIEPSPTAYLSDIDAGFYVSNYLRSWALEAQLRDHLRGEFGSDWFRKREAGSLLRELWSLGQKPTAEELLRDVTGATLTMEAVADRIREVLR
jgi:hypothetical protein